MTTFIKIPFADSGDRTEVPLDSTSGEVNWTTGYTSYYSQDPATEATAKRIGRSEFNGVLHTLSSAINDIQRSGICPYIRASDNGGNPYPYAKGATVYSDNQVWVNLQESNTKPPSPDPSTGWATLSDSSQLGTVAALNAGESASDNVPTMSSYVNNKSRTGYQRLPGGLIIQWGVVAMSAGQQVKDVSFIVDFPKTVLNINVTDTGSQCVTYGTYGATTSTFTLARSAYSYNSTGHLVPAQETGCYFFAIGY